MPSSNWCRRWAISSPPATRSSASSGGANHPAGRASRVRRDRGGADPGTGPPVCVPHPRRYRHQGPLPRDQRSDHRGARAGPDPSPDAGHRPEAARRRPGPGRRGGPAARLRYADLVRLRPDGHQRGPSLRGREPADRPPPPRPAQSPDRDVAGRAKAAASRRISASWRPPCSGGSWMRRNRSGPRSTTTRALAGPPRHAGGSPAVSVTPRSGLEAPGLGPLKDLLRQAGELLIGLIDRILGAGFEVLQGSDNHWILLANSHSGRFGRNLGKMGAAGKGNPRFQTPQTNSPTVSSLDQKVGLSRAWATPVNMKSVLLKFLRPWGFALGVLGRERPALRSRSFLLET